MGLINFGLIGGNNNKVQIEPRDIFMSLPSRDKQYEYPRDVQTEVWKKWFNERNNRNCIIKMNTGSGKTVVGLTILKSCLNENKGPAVFVVPDNYLVKQVCEEANRLGINITTDYNDVDFIRKRSILIINIQTLVNGKSVFGMRSTNNISIGSVLIDDAHACIASIESQYTISIPNNDELYKEFVNVFSSSLKNQSENKFTDIIEQRDLFASMLIPFWDWQSNSNVIYKILSDNLDNSNIGFSFPLLKDCLSICNCVISTKSIEITPPCVPIDKISSFERAERRIFMSATLLDDSIFITSLGLKQDECSSIISPEKANDIGDRLMIFPQVMNKSISDKEIKDALKEASLSYNVVVIVPSYNRAKYWQDVSDLELNISNLTDGVAKLKTTHVGLTVIINKYDGVDLPETACEILAIDGLPVMRSEYDAFEQNANPTNRRLCCEQIQKIEQGMGRGVRSNTDHCVVFLLGRALVDIIYGSDGYLFFSDATKKQFELSQQLWEQLEKPNMKQIMELADYSLKRNTDWISACKDALSTVNYCTNTNFNNISLAIRKAFDEAILGQYINAKNSIENEKNICDNLETVGLLKMYMAQYTNFINPEEAQQILLSAIKDNKSVIKPLQGIQYDKILNKTGVQAQTLIKYISDNNIQANNYILKINALCESLCFKEDTAKRFEQSLKELSFMLGIYSNRPENECGRGPDNFWDIGNNSFLIIECKNGTITPTISKSDCNQLNGSINWFESLYRDNSSKAYPIMIHNSNTFEYASSPDNKIRIMTPELLDNFKSNIILFAQSLVQPENINNSANITTLLNQFDLLGCKIVDTYTKNFSMAHRAIV